MIATPHRQIIRNALVLRPGEAQAEPLDILIEGDTIVEIGPAGLEAPADAKLVDASRRLLHPGLVNAHTHGHGALGKAMGDRWSLELLLVAGPWLSGSRSLEDKYLSAALNAAEMVLKGCTACYDLFLEIPSPSRDGMAAVAKAYGDVGMRATIAPMLADLSLYQAVPGLLDALPERLQREVERLRLKPYRETLRDIEAFVKGEGSNGDRLNLALAPTIPMHCTDELLCACRDCARDFGLRLHSHVAESKVQALAAKRHYGRTITAHIEALGLLGPHFTAAHGVWLDDDDMRQLADRGASVAHNPGSNMRLGSGIADVRAMLRAGLNVAIGSDGSNSSDNQNMYEATRLASLASKVRGPDMREWLTTSEALSAATQGGAKALGFAGKIGRIEPGFKADLVFVSLDHINWLPHNHTINQLVHVEDGTAVESVMIGGRFVVENRKITTIDLPALGRQAEAARDRLAAANASKRELAQKLEEVVAKFCIGLARQPYPVDRYGAASR